MRVSTALRIVRGTVLALSVIAGPGVAVAQTVFDQNGFSGSHSGYSTLPYEQVDPLSGNLIIVTTDLSLPGNNGLDLSVRRVYNSAIYPNYDNNHGSTRDTTPQEDSWAGIGWRLHFGRVINEDLTASGPTKIEMGDGSVHALHSTSARPEGWITGEFWVYNRITYQLKLPNGLVYTFGRRVYIAGLGWVRYVTEIRDPFNNTITFAYFAAGGPPDGVAQIVQDLGAGQVRTVNFTYDTTLNAIHTMEFDNHVWTYTHDPSGPMAGYSVLKSVKPPLGGQWSYTYETPTQANYYGLTSMQAPQGGIVSYTYSNSTRYAGSFSQITRVVATRSVGGPSNVYIDPGTWTFTYNDGPNKDQTRVDCPCGGSTIYTYYGIGTGTTGFEAWRAGLLANRRVVLGSNAYEVETWSWAPSAAISPDPVPATNGVWGDPAIYNALPTQHVLQRDSKTWTTTFEYNTANYNDYGQPFRVTESDGTRSRVTTQTFTYNFSPAYIGPKVASRQVAVGADTRSSSYHYEASTGFLLDSTVDGIPTYFDHLANGDLRSVTDAHVPGHQTLFSYSWGAVSQMQTPLLTTSRQISNAGLVTREQNGPLFTDYEYDDAFRPRVTRPPGTQPVTYEYDTLYDSWYRVARGTAQTQYNLDGFGRPISTSNQVGLKTLTGRDACGRINFQSLPYTSGTFANRGTQTTYDVLSRITRSHFSDGQSETADVYFTYNGLNATMTDPLGRTTTQEYSAFGGPGDALLSAFVDSAGQRTTYTYNVAGQLTAIGGAVAPRSWTYNALGQLQQSTNPESGTTTYAYDAAGLPTTVTDAQGQAFQLTYDANHRVTVADGPGSGSDLSLTYDTLGRLASQNTSFMATSYQFDAATGRASGRLDTGGGQSYQSTYGYDNVDNVTSITYPSGRVVAYTYDVERRLTGITQNGVAFATNFTYDDGGGLASYVTGATTHTIEYDRWQRVHRMTAGAAGSPALDLTYAYNQDSQITNITDVRPGYSWVYGYDVLNRLTSAWGPYTGFGWQYDAKGNRTVETQFDAVINYSYDQNTQRLTSTSGAVNESFTYDTLGRLTSDNRGVYSYTPTGKLSGVTAANLTASYLYDADSLRVSHTVNGVSTYSLRSLGGQTLSEYVSPCGAASTWSKDLIYGAGRLLGAIKATPSQPTVGFAVASSSVPENAGTASVAVKVTTPGGTALTCPVTVSWATQATAGTGTDYRIAQGALTFPIGTSSGSTQNITIVITDDTIDEPDETVSLLLSQATGATIGAAQHVVTILDNDPPPSLTINDVSVTEGPGVVARFTVSLSAVSAKAIGVDIATSPDTALNTSDLIAASAHLTFNPGETTKTFDVQIVDDLYAEPAEGFWVSLANPSNATLARATGRGTILDNEPARVPIDPTLPGQYFPDVTTTGGYYSYLLIYNPNAVSVTAHLTFTRPDGSGMARNIAVAAHARITLDVGAEPGIGGTGDVSAVVQTTNASYPLVAENSTYWQSDWRGGRNTRGAPPSAYFFFGEGAAGTGGFFEEYVTVFNPSNVPIKFTMMSYSTAGGYQWFSIPIPTGPGRVKLRMSDYITPGDHGTEFAGRDVNTNADMPIVVERTMYWGNGDRREGHSANGEGAPAGTFYFAEGGSGPYSTYIALSNPYPVASNVEVDLLHENGSEYRQYGTIPAFGRLTLTPPGTMPAGAFAFSVATTNNVLFNVDRSMYYGPNWELGDSVTGTATLSTVWRFAEGSSGYFNDWLLLGNFSTTTANVTLTFHLENGSTVTSTTTVPPRGRKSVSLDAIPGLTGNNYAFDVTVTNGVPIVAERSMYWPNGAWNGSHTQMGRPQ